jgi:hypothetical protein
MFVKIVEALKESAANLAIPLQHFNERRHAGKFAIFF